MNRAIETASGTAMSMAMNDDHSVPNVSGQTHAQKLAPSSSGIGPMIAGTAWATRKIATPPSAIRISTPAVVETALKTMSAGRFLTAARPAAGAAVVIGLPAESEDRVNASGRGGGAPRPDDAALRACVC